MGVSDVQSPLQSCQIYCKSDILGNEPRITKSAPCEKNLLHLQLDLTCLSCSAEYRVAGFGLFAMEVMYMYVHI